MYPRVTFGENARKVSPCNRPAIKAVVEARGSCLTAVSFQCRLFVFVVVISYLYYTKFTQALVVVIHSRQPV